MQPYNQLPGDVVPGVLIRVTHLNQKSTLLVDTTPTPSVKDAALTAGRSIRDEASRTQITVDSFSPSTGADITVSRY